MVTAAEQGQLTRARLMDAAAELIAERGWGAVTTRMVAERAGLRPGLVHYHFDSVTDLLIDSSLRAAQAEVARILQPALTRAGRDALAELIQAGASWGTGPGGPGQGAAVFVEMLLAARRHERLRSALAGMLAGARAAVGQLVRAGERGADGQATAEVLLAAFDGLLLHRLLDPALGDPALGGPAIAAPLRRLAGIPEVNALVNGANDDPDPCGSPRPDRPDR
jgi:TetR/AcrR family transcriptional regulator, regulator of biofilm formation and stress response